MIFHDSYASVADPEVSRFIEAQELGRLVTVGGDGMPHVGLYPFVRAADALEGTLDGPRA